MTNEKIIWDFLLTQGLNAYGVAGLMGNLYAESGLIPNNLQNTFSQELGLSDIEYTKQVDNGTYTNFIKDSAGYGLAQWTHWSRKQNLLNYAKSKNKSIGDLNIQLEFLIKELETNFPKVYKVLKTAKTVEEASNSVLMDFEKPASAASQKSKRINLSMIYYNKYVKGVDNIMTNGTYNKGQATQLTTNFKSIEFDCHGKNCCSTTIIDLELVKILQKIREHFGISININSGYRCAIHNKNVGGASQSYHTKGKAADIAIKGITPKQIAQYAESIGVKGIGVYKTFVHIDTRPSKYYWYDGGASNVSTFKEQNTTIKEEIKKENTTTTTPIGPVINSTSSTDTITITTILKRGSTGNQVKLLQKRLILLGYDLGTSKADGNFGIKTYNAVIAFQKAKNLTIDGLVGNQTENALNKALINMTIETIPNLLNVRSGPSTKNKIIRILKRGSKYSILEQKNGWVKLNDINGWVSIDYIKKY